MKDSVKKFGDMGITLSSPALEGTKMTIDDILNKTIVVQKYRIVSSKYGDAKGNGKCLHLQFLLNDIQHVVFTSSMLLQELCERIGEQNMPFEATIIKRNKGLIFT